MRCALCALLLRQAQQPKTVSRIGYLGLIESRVVDEAFRRGLREQGYVEGQNFPSSTGMGKGESNVLRILQPSWLG